jgi:serine/threonine-protein kinase
MMGPAEAPHHHQVLKRYEREAQATALMRSPHTMALYDFGVADDGAFYDVMELLDGFDLQLLVRKFGPLPAERVIHLLRQVLRSLGEAHASGLIHRDIKPANIYLCRYGREVDFIKVLDFGLVKHAPADGDSETGVTGEHAVGGTPAYMSPEQAMGGPVDARSDLYSVGCVAYWLLTGSLVFSGTTAMDLIIKHAEDRPQPPSGRGGISIPPGLESIILDCLAKDPAARPQTADQLAARLAAVPLTEAWTPELAHAWWQMHRPQEPRRMDLSRISSSIEEVIKRI